MKRRLIALAVALSLVFSPLVKVDDDLSKTSSHSVMTKVV